MGAIDICYKIQNKQVFELQKFWLWKLQRYGPYRSLLLNQGFLSKTDSPTYVWKKWGLYLMHCVDAPQEGNLWSRNFRDCKDMCHERGV